MKNITIQLTPARSIGMWSRSKGWILAGILVLSASNISSGALLTMDFSSTGGTIKDAQGEGTGFTNRLGNTGGSLAANDTNINIVTGGTGTFAITTNSTSNFNGQSNMASTEAVGIPLSTLGLTTANENFSVSATFLNIPTTTTDNNQFGIYVGTSSTNMIRGGFLYFGNRLAFGVPTNSTGELGGNFGSSPAAGGTLVATISRTNGVFKVLVGNGTTSVDVTPGQPTFLNGLSTLQAGIYATRAGGSVFTATADTFSASVVPEPTTLGLLGLGGMSLLRRKRKN